MINFHLIFGLLSLISGLVVIFMPKGTGQHRLWGYVYVISMLILCGSSFFIMELFGNFGVFHVMSLVSLITVIFGYGIMIQKKIPLSRRVAVHYKMMLFSYVGLVMATNSHFFKYLGPYLFKLGMSKVAALVITALVLWIIPYAIGSFFIYRYWPVFKKRFSDKTMVLES